MRNKIAGWSILILVFLAWAAFMIAAFGWVNGLIVIGVVIVVQALIVLGTTLVGRG